MGVKYNTIENVPIASFETSWKNESANQPLEELKFLISPSQSFNGYSAPWPPGGGKNKGQLTVPAVTRGLTFTLNADGSMTISGKATSSGGIFINSSTYNTNTTPILPAGSYTASVTSFPTSGVASNTRFVLNAKYADDTTVEFSPMQLTFGGGILRPGKVTTTEPFKLALYMYVNLDDEFDYTMQFQLEAGSEQTDWVPYSNICPISGKTAANVYHAGRNLFTTGGTPGGSSTSAGITFTYNADGTITLNGRNNGTNISASTHMANFRLPPGTYKKSVFRDKVGIYVQKKVSSSSWVNVSGGGIFFDTFTITEDDAKYDLSVRIGIGNGLDFDFDNFVCEPYIYKDGEPLTYEKPNYTRYPVSWQTEAGEVYGGTVDVVSGLLTVTMVNIASYNGETIGEPWLSSMDRYAPGATPTIGTQVVYTLLSPQTYQLTAQRINTLLGTNNVWSNIGNIKRLTWQYNVFDLLQVFINGFEITDLIAFGGWQRERNDVDGPEAGRTLDAKMHRARVATKMRYNVTCRPMLAGELASLERLIMPEYVTVKVVGDPYYGTWERTCYVNNTSAKYLIRKRSGAQWWGGITFPIIEV